MELSLSFDQIVLKRFFDIILSIIGLLIAFIPMFVISLCIKLTSPGPVLYHQKRVGQYGKPFILYKFRTMIDGANRFFHHPFHNNLSDEEIDYVVEKVREGIEKLGG